MTYPGSHLDHQQPRSRVPRWMAALSGVVGALVGTATNLYSAESREILEKTGREATTSLLPILAPGVAGAGVTMLVLWLLVRRRRPARTTAKELRIGVDALQTVHNVEDRIVNKSLHYLETKRSSDTLVILLHGLGLDGDDFRPYIHDSRHHCIALTLFGFNASEERNEAYRPVSLDTHVQLAAYAIKKFHQRYPRKKLVLVGFSFGADLLLFLAQSGVPVWSGIKRARVVLLDPNVNRSTTTISSRISAVGPQWDVQELARLLDSARNIPEFRYLCEYLKKITTKNCDQVREHAKEVVARWGDAQSIDLFLERLRTLCEVTSRVQIYLSSNHDGLYNRIVREVTNLKINVERDVVCPPVAHFELIEPDFLKSAVEDS